MGLLIENYNLQNGLISEQAYIKVDFLNGNKHSMVADTKIYVSREASLDGLPSIGQKLITFTPSVEDNASNYHKQAYEHLKTLSEFEGAIDVLEEGQNA